MKLSNEQLLQLRNIDSQYSKLEFFSQKTGVSLEEMVELYHFGIIDLEELNIQKSRQQVFQQSQIAKKSKFSN